jgi:hypothetical protein
VVRTAKGLEDWHTSDPALTAVDLRVARRPGPGTTSLSAYLSLQQKTAHLKAHNSLNMKRKLA